jgi:O-antigen/teichoic acid export membrane protein
VSDTTTSTAMSPDRQLAATIGKNTIFGIVASGVQIGTRLVSVPVVIHYLGLGGYGIWSIIMVTAAYMRFGTAGIKSAFQKYVAEATGNGDFEKANKLVSTGSISILLLSLAGLIPVAILSHKLALATGVPAEFLSSAAASITVLAAIYVVSNFGAAYESIVMGGHRIDLTRKYTTVLTVLEAIIIIALLHAHYGLFAMALVMGASELIYIFCCYRMSLRIVPEMHISMAHFTTSVFPELIRFAGSYQLVSMLQLFYRAVVPIALLKFFGAEAAGIAALADRLTSSALIGQEALALPILSGGTMVFTAGSAESLKLFFAKSFKVTIAATVPPLTFVCAFGAPMIYAWTGQTNSQFRLAILLVSLAAFPRAVSLLQLVLYRASGRAVHDNISQVLRIIVILIVAYFGRRIGFYGVLGGMAVAELVGVIFMVYAMAMTFHAFDVKMLMRDGFRIAAATTLVIGAGAAAGMIPIQWGVPERVTALIRLGQVGLGCLLMAWPALLVTKSVSGAERRTLLDAIVPGRRRILQVNE